ncbi:MAG TPA: serine/threonine-protein kinase [Polyangiaceae bacterium]|nr:serine/threonine-protein kinase [Polyangiaceae bacterium]
MIEVGSVINGKYRLLRLLGDGGMGTVYEAAHAALGTRVAIKVLHADLGRRPGLVERFLQEARATAQIRSPHVVTVSDVDRTADGHAYIVMELIEGEALSAIVHRTHKLSVPLACGYVEQILLALEAAHALGVVHRDLKPENVLVTIGAGQPVLKLIDFGIAKAQRGDGAPRNLTVAGVLMGTPEYMAPEQVHSADKVDARADIYAVGVMLYEMIAGARPVRGDDARSLAARVERGEVTPLLQLAPEAPREIAGLVHRAMAARPELRFSTATEMRFALQNAMSARRQSTAVLSPGQPSSRAQAPWPAVTPASAERERSADTIRAAPIAAALAPSPSPGAVAAPLAISGPVVTGRSARRPSRGLFAVIAVSVLAVGAGVLGAVIVGLVGAGIGGWGPSAREPSPNASVPPLRMSAAPLREPPASPPPSVPRLAPLVPLAPARTSPAPRVVSSAGASGLDAGATGLDAGASGLDADAASLTLPSALPSALSPFEGVVSGVIPLPSSFPTTLPSGLPGVFPQWPPPIPATDLADAGP